MHNVQIGESAEAYVYYRLLSWGYNVHFASGISSPFDLWLNYEDKIIRIQVKGSSCLESHRRQNSYNFWTVKGGKKVPYEKQDFDILALVALPMERAFFCSNTPAGRRKRIKSDKFEYDWEIKTWRKTLQQWEEENDKTRV